MGQIKEFRHINGAVKIHRCLPRGCCGAEWERGGWERAQREWRSVRGCWAGEESRQQLGQSGEAADWR